MSIPFKIILISFAYDLWARHVEGLTVTNSSFNYEKPGNRYVIFFDDVIEAKTNEVKTIKSKEISSVIKLNNSSDVKIEN